MYQKQVLLLYAMLVTIALVLHILQNSSLLKLVTGQLKEHTSKRNA